MMMDTSNSNSTELLNTARHLIRDGKPSQALQAVLMAMKSKGGDHVMLQALQRARELYRQRLHEKTSVDQLASLFAECAIAEADPQPSQSFYNDSSPLNKNGPAILAETGRDQIVLDAFADGSSFICLQCGGLVSVHRKDEHYAYWLFSQQVDITIKLAQTHITCMVYFPKTASFSRISSPPAAEDMTNLLLSLERRENVRLTKKEVKELFNGLGSRWSSWRVWRAMKYADENGDGVITQNEMNQLLIYCKKHGFVAGK